MIVLAFGPRCCWRAGEDAHAVLSRFASAHDLTAAQLTGVGAFASATVAWRGWLRQLSTRPRPYDQLA